MKSIEHLLLFAVMLASFAAVYSTIDRKSRDADSLTQCEDKLAETNASLSAAESELHFYYENFPVHLYPCKSYQTEPC